MTFQVETTKLEAMGPKITTYIDKLKAKVDTIKVTNKEDFNIASEVLGEIKTRLSMLEDMRIEATKPLNDYVKKLNLAAKSKSEPLKAMEEKLKWEVKIWMDAEAEKAEAEAARLRKEQEEKERIEQEKLEEARRKEEEARIAEQKAKDEAFEAKTKRARLEAEKREKEAREARESEAAKAAAAQKELENTEVATVDAPQKSIRTEAGLITRKLSWKWRVKDLKLTKKSFPELFVLDEKKVDYMVAEGARNIPGLEIFQESDISMKR